MTAESKLLSASLTAPKLPDNLFTVADIDAELSKVRDDESDFIAADFLRKADMRRNRFFSHLFQKLPVPRMPLYSLRFFGCTFIDCVFKGCDISNSDFSGKLFQKPARSSPVKWSEQLFKYSFYKNVSFDGGSFELSDFSAFKTAIGSCDRYRLLPPLCFLLAR